MVAMRSVAIVGGPLLAATLLIGACVARGAAALPEPLCPGGSSPNPNVLMCENFEDGDFQERWDIGDHNGKLAPAQFVLCTGDSFGFHDRCAAWTNRLIFDHEWGFYGYDARRKFPPQSEFYIRWYQSSSNPYVWGTLEDKSFLIHDRGNTITAYVGSNRDDLPTVRDSGPGMPYIANYQDIDRAETAGLYTKVNRFQNQGRNITLQPGTWYLFEWYIKLNTPGQSNGIARLWIDDATKPISTQTLRMQYDDMRWLKADQIGKQFGEVRLTVYDQRCDIGRNTCPPNGPSILDQSQRWDQIVVSKAPIGPMVPQSRIPSPSRSQ